MSATMSSSSTPLTFDLPERDTITDVFVARVASDPHAHMLSLLENDREVAISAQQFHREVVEVAKGLIAKGIKPGDRVGIFGATSYEWTTYDFAIWFAGGVSVPFYDTSSEDQLAWILKDTDLTFVVAQSQDHSDRVAQAAQASGIEATLDISVWDEEGRRSLVAAGRDVTAEAVEAARSSRSKSDDATIIYTSGTTGRSRGCVLTHANFVDTAASAAVQINQVVTPGARCLLFIPTAHVFARFIEVMSILHGVTLAHESDLTRLTEALGVFRPTFILGVPRVFEKVFNSALQKAEAENKAPIFRAAEAVAVQYSVALSEGKVSPWLKAKHKFFDVLVYSKLRAVLGGQATHAVSGGGPLGFRLGHFFKGIGVDILEGYGLTETTAPIAVNTPGKSKIGTVGVPLPGNTVAVAPDGEILAKGVSVFKEYLNDPQATQDAFIDGWFCTGDFGTLDEDGYVSVTGRKKELIITAGGKNVAPAPFEDELRRHPVIGQAVVIGEGKKFVSVLIFPDMEMLPAWLENRGLPALSLEDVPGNEKINESVSRAIEVANRRVSRAESIREYRIVPAQLTEQNGYLSAKQSVKRHIVNKDFSSYIDDIYGPENAR
ncbi:AMP-binding enzyme [Brevibacterium mcbrellneri ATCC 49030]|uniref:Acyl-CoA synthetase n=1 Tax=Brevibacterium mcbrellneri ATCC 49030 TaxID=585530 RepID=D4YKR9_9MICO|nr:long-chain fatty acid--CoA ligase [Brevibacterium mcbrellneri]EFG48272.1 AMP-binding enzyme [Brevibacterium mcbrellneri ATCC 49030]